MNSIPIETLKVILITCYIWGKVDVFVCLLHTNYGDPKANVRVKF